MKNKNLIFILKRLLHSIFILLVISIVIFALARVIPGDPARMALGERASEEVLQRFRIAMHYDKPIFVQYYYWLNDLLHGNLGMSLVTKFPVLEDIAQVFPATFELAIYTFFFMLITGITIGTVSARYHNTWVDNLGRIIAYFGIITPSFVFAIIGMLIFCYMFEILPSMGRLSPELFYQAKITGLITIDALLQGNFVVFFDALKHLILPVVSLGLLGLAEDARITRNSVYNNMGKDYIISAQSYGIPERVIMFQYLLKPSINPVVSMLGLQFASILARAFLVELIFNWPGFARYGMNAILYKDINAISGVVLILSVFILLGNIMVDIIVGFLDPRIYLMEGSNE